MKRLTLSILGLAIGALSGCGADSEIPTLLPALLPTEIDSTKQANFVNGDFEDGTLNGWTVQTFARPAIPVYPPTKVSDLGLTAGGVNLTTLLTGAQPETMVPNGLAAGDSLKYPRFGKYATMVNQGGSTANANILTQSMTTTLADVDPADNKIHVRFALAPILEDGAHAKEQQAYFFVAIRNDTKNQDIYTTFNFANQPGIPYKTSVGNAAYRYTDWQLFDWAPGPVGIAVGDKVSVTLVGSRCSPSGHAGQLLVDGFGSFLPALTVVATGPQSVNVGNNIVYNFRAANGSTVVANNVVVREKVPAGTTYVSAVGATCTPPDAMSFVTCNLGTLNAGQTKDFQLIVQAPNMPASVVNGEYTIQSTGTSPLIGPPVRTAVTQGQLYTDLNVTATSNTPAATQGDPVEYVIVVTNNGPTAVNGAQIKDIVPPGMTGVTWMCSAASGAMCAMPSGSGGLNTTANIPIGGSVTYTVKGTVGAGALPRMDYVVTASPSAAIIDGNTANNAAQASTAIGTTQSLTVNKGNSTGAGTVVSRPDGILCDETCTMMERKFLAGSTVTLVATPALGDTFGGWGGACANAGMMPTCTVKMDQVTAVTANFVAGVKSPADLQVALTDNLLGKLPAPGMQVKYTLDVSNQGPTAVMNAVLNTSIPGDLSNVTWTCVATGTAMCPAPSGQGQPPSSVSLDSGSKLTYVVTGTASPKPASPMTMTATVVPPRNISDPNPANNTAVSTVANKQSGDLAIDITKSPDAAKPGETTTYTAQVTNSGPDTVSRPQVVINLPPGAQVLMAPAGDGWTCTSSGNTYVCVREDAPPGSLPPITAQIVTPVPASEGGPGSTVIGTVGAPFVSDPNPANNTDIVDPTGSPVVQADLALTLTKSAGNTPLGTETTYTAVLSNKGPGTAQSPTVTFTLPPGTLVTQEMPGEGWSCVRSDLTYTCLRSSLAPGDAPPIVIKAITPVPSDGSMNGGVLIATANATQLQDPDPANNTASVPVGTEPPTTGSDLSVKLSRSPDGAQAGDVVTYTLQAANKGPDSVDNVVVTMTLPPGAEVVSPPAGDGWTCTQNQNTFTCTRPKLAQGEAPPLTAQIRLPQGGDPSIYKGVGAGTATINATNNGDPNPADNVFQLDGDLYKLAGGGLTFGCAVGMTPASASSNWFGIFGAMLVLGRLALRQTQRRRRVVSL